LHDWWAIAKKASYPQGLCDMGMRLAAARPHSANIERNFSTLSSVYGKLRTRMSIQRSKKLAFLFRNLRAARFDYDSDSDEDFE
jgi:hypothetical protein